MSDSTLAKSDNPLLVDRRETARLLDLSERTVSTLTASGEIPHIRIRRCVRYSIADLQQFIASRRKEANR